MNKHFIILLLFLCIKAQGQITVISGQTANSLAQELAGPGIQVSNAILTCDTQAYARFEIAPPNTSNLGIGAGIVLTSGSAFNNGFNQGVNNPSSIITTANSNLGDPDLALLTTNTIRDACKFEFDFIPLGDTIKFEYIFASCEYPGFTCSAFNDIFGFFISGPGITGPFTGGAQNIAIVPGTTSCPVGVNTINCPNSAGCCNTTTNCVANGAGCGSLTTAQTCNMFVCNAPTNPNSNTVVYPGFTIPLTATAVTIPCSTYHLKLAIADATDQSLDSGVFLKAGSLSSNNVSLSFNTATGLATPFIVEGCDSLTIKIKRSIAGAGVIQPDTVNVYFSGSAIMGTDYNTPPGQVYFAGSLLDTVQTIVITPYADGIWEVGDSITIKLATGCNASVSDSITVFIKDTLDFQFANTNTAVCVGATINTFGIGYPGMTFAWTPGANFSNPFDINSVCTPTVGTQTYTVTSSYLNCPQVSKSFTVITDPIPSISMQSLYTLCSIDSIQLSASISPTLVNYVWSPSSNLLNTNSLNPLFVGTNSQIYTLTATTTNAFCTSSAISNVTVYQQAQGTINILDTLVCGGTVLQLNANTPLGNYQWFPNYYISCTNCPNPIVNPPNVTTYSVVFTQPQGCQDTLTSKIQINPPFTLTLVNQDTTIEPGTTIELVSYGAFGYNWVPSYYLGNTNGNITYAAPMESITYTLIGTDTFNSCPQYKELKVKVIEKDIFTPNVFTPNGDKINDVFKLTSKKYVKIQEFRIFNRWGQEMFSSIIPNEGWDGTFKGAPCDAATYFYTATYSYSSGRTEQTRGEFVLMR
jgi:gliding motility-associated-like protein